MSAHPLANDMTVDPVLRRVFATVTHQIVRHYEDSSEWSWNLNRVQTPDRYAILEHETGRVGSVVDGKILASVELRAL